MQIERCGHRLHSRSRVCGCWQLRVSQMCQLECDLAYTHPGRLLTCLYHSINYYVVTTLFTVTPSLTPVMAFSHLRYTCKTRRPHTTHHRVRRERIFSHLHSTTPYYIYNVQETTSTTPLSTRHASRALPLRASRAPEVLPVYPRERCSVLFELKYTSMIHASDRT